MRTLLGMQYGGNVPQQYSSNMPQQYPSNMPQQYPRQQIPPQQFQEGGGVSSGLAYLLRGKKKREAIDEASSRERAMGKRIGWGKTAGSVGGIGLGLLGAALAPATGGLSLALAAGLGTAAGKYAGSRIGYGKDKEMSDMMYGKEAGFEDIAKAGEDYRSQMLQEAGISGVKAGLTAGFAPGGGMYGKVGGKLAGTGAGWSTAAGGAAGLPVPEAVNIAGAPVTDFGSSSSLLDLTKDFKEAGSIYQQAGAAGAQASQPTGISFQDAFRKARQQFGGAGTFDWRGNPYSTAYAP